MQLERLTQRSREALDQAGQLAPDLQHPQVEPEHLLLALVDQAAGVAGIELNWWESQYRFRGSDRETSPSLMVGVGHRFNSSWSMEFNLDWGQFRSYVGTASDIKGGVFYRF